MQSRKKLYLTFSPPYSILKDVYSIYKILEAAEIPVPEVLGVSTEYFSSGNCNIYFKNTFTLDIEVKDINNSIKDYILKILPVLEQNNRKLTKDFDPKMFMYDMNKKTFVLVDFTNMIYTFNAGETTHMENHYKELTAKIKNKDFLAEELNFFKFDFMHDDYRVVQTGFVDPSKPVESTLNDQEIQQSKNSSKILMIELIRQETEWTVTSTLNTDKQTLTFNEEIELFSLYLCQEVKSKIECINLKEGDTKDKMSWNFNIKPNHIVDVNIRKIFSGSSEFNLNFYKVFLTLKEIHSMKIVPTGPYNRDTINDDTNKQDIILTDNGALGFVVNSINSKNYKVTLPFNPKLEADIGIEIYPITYLEYEFLLSHVNKQPRHYQIRIPANKIIILSEKEKNLNSKIQLFDKNASFDALFYKKCKIDSILLNLSENESPFSLKFENEEKSFPEKITIEEFESSNTHIKCIEINESKFKFWRMIDIPAEKKFLWNFNLHQNRGFVQLFDQTTKKSPIFPFKNFEYPKKSPLIIYLSIGLKDEKGNLDIHASFYNKENTKIDVPLSKSISSSPINQIPKEFNFDINLSAQTLKRVNVILSDQNASYLSNKEIVYSIEISNFDKCLYLNYLYLDKNSIILDCRKSITVNKQDFTTCDSEALSHILGLAKVLEQTSPKGKNLLI